ncbi:MAG: hypothetical protein AB1555_19925 [Nitrospirota bacterium]
MQKLSELHKNVLGYCQDDYTGLWLVVWVITRDLVRQQPGGRELLDMVASKAWDAELGAQLEERELAIDQKLVREKVLQILRDLLEAGLIEAGCPTEDGKWESWSLSPADTMNRIQAEWEALGHEPGLGDVAWFISTMEGDRVLSQGTERNVASEN